MCVLCAKHIFRSLDGYSATRNYTCNCILHSCIAVEILMVSNFDRNVLDITIYVIAIFLVLNNVPDDFFSSHVEIELLRFCVGIKIAQIGRNAKICRVAILPCQIYNAFSLNRNRIKTCCSQIATCITSVHGATRNTTIIAISIILISFIRIVFLITLICTIRRSIYARH